MKIPLFEIYSDTHDIQAINVVIKRKKFWATGPEIEQFEKALCQFTGSKYAVVFNSGTSALHSLLLAFGIGPGDEVIVPSFTFIATANVPLFVGARPVFADIEEKTFGLDLRDVERKITKKTKAIILMHYGGNPCIYTEDLRKLAKDRHLLFFEDAAQSLGAKIGNKYAGTFGDGAVLSFCQNKIITTGEGGAAITDSQKIYQKLKLICSHGRIDKNNYFSSSDSGSYIGLGYNFRMSSMTAALGLAQLKKINKIIQLRRSVAMDYKRKLSRLKHIKLPLEQDNSIGVYQMFSIQVHTSIRNKLQQFLKKQGIQTKVYFEPVHLTAFYKSKFAYKKGYLQNTEIISKEILSIPIYPDLTSKTINYIIKHIQIFFENN